MYINTNSSWVDTCPITIGARTLVGPHCSFYSGTHPVDPFLRNGIRGPESGAPIVIGEDCWLGGNVIVLPGVTIGRGTTIGAGSVVTKDIPSFVVAAGNPARVLREIDVSEAQKAEAKVLTGRAPRLPHRPPCIENEDMMSTRTLIQPHMNGIQVDIQK